MASEYRKRNLVFYLKYRAKTICTSLFFPMGLYQAQWNICQQQNDDVIKGRHFSRHWPFVRGIHRSPVNSLHKGQWRGALVFSLICVWINVWVNNREVDDLRRHRAHYNITVMIKMKYANHAIHTQAQRHWQWLTYHEINSNYGQNMNDYENSNWSYNMTAHRTCLNCRELVRGMQPIALYDLAIS